MAPWRGAAAKGSSEPSTGLATTREGSDWSGGILGEVGEFEKREGGWREVEKVLRLCVATGLLFLTCFFFSFFLSEVTCSAKKAKATKDGGGGSTLQE